MTDEAGRSPEASAPLNSPLHDLVGILFRRRAIVGLAFVVTTAVATAIPLILPRTYEASSAVIADKNPPVVLLSSAGTESGFLQNPASQAPDAYTLTELAKTEAVRDAVLASLSPTLGRSKIKDILTRGLRVQQVRSSDLVRITVKARDPGVAAAVANAVADGVVAMDLTARRRLATVAREFVGEQLELASQKLQGGEDALAAFKRKSHDVSLSDETQLNLRKLADLETELTDVHIQQQEAQSGFERPVSQPRQAASLVPDPVITSLQSQLAALEVESSGLRKQFTPAHPQVISTQAKIEETRRRLNAEIARKQSALGARDRSLKAEIDRIEQALMRVPSEEAALARHTRETKGAERAYLLLSEKFQQARVAEGSIGSAVRIVDVAKPSRTPVGLQSRTSLTFGAILGLLLGVGGAFAMEQLDPTVWTRRDVERVLSAPVLGAAPLLDAHAGRAGPILGGFPKVFTELDPASNVAESFRVLRTHVLRAMERGRSKCIVVTSALRGEGKSVVATNLAVAAAQTDRSVWLVDCNFRHPTLHEVFPEADSPGLSDLLVGRAGIDAVVRPTGHPRLQCVVSGPQVGDPTELLDTQVMTQFLEHARGRADLVLLDSPAVHPVTDAEVIGLRADGAILIVQIGKTDRLALAQVRQRLTALGVGIIGAVLNHSASPPAPRFAAPPGAAQLVKSLRFLRSG